MALRLAFVGWRWVSCCGSADADVAAAGSVVAQLNGSGQGGRR